MTDYREELAGRSMVVRKTRPLPIECVVRGYVSGSGWKDYRATGKICGIALPPGLRESDRLHEPIFTPATKATSGHDENISFEQAAALIGRELAERVRSVSIDIYQRAARYAEPRGILLADTKFEFGLLKNSAGVTNSSGSTKRSRRTLRASGPPRNTSQAGHSLRSTNSLYAIILNAFSGRRLRRAQTSLPMSSPRPALNIGKPTASW